MLETALLFIFIERVNKLLYSIIKGKCLFINGRNQQVMLCKSFIGTHFGYIYNIFRYNHNSTSETKRENSVFIDWFIGFSEGDGCFAVDLSSGRLFFKIRQKEPRILFKIKKELNIGIVFLSKDGYWTYSVSSKDQILILIHLFNGRLQLNKTQERFQEWVSAYNLLWPDKCVILKNHVIISDYGSNSWLCGFSDAEGSFSVYLGPSPRNRMRLKWYIDQCDELIVLIKIQSFFNTGHIENKKCGKFSTNENCHRLIVDSFRGIVPILDYFIKYPPNTVKLMIRFTRVRKLLPYALNGTYKDHLNHVRNVVRLNKRLNNKSVSF